MSCTDRCKFFVVFQHFSTFLYKNEAEIFQQSSFCLVFVTN
jgi:hypothetical protein